MNRPSSPSPMATSTSAASEVFGVPELLHKILRNLSFEETLLAQRISKKVVENIVSIYKEHRHKLFLEHASIDNTVQLIPITPTFVITYEDGPSKPYMILDFLQRPMQTYFDKMGINVDNEGNTSVNTSWWNMFPMQPAPKRLAVEVQQYPGRQPNQIYTMEHEVGITLGALSEIAWQERHRGHTVRFYIPLRPWLADGTLELDG